MANPFNENASAISQASGSFKATPTAPVQATNRFQPLIDSMLRATGAKVQGNAQANAELAAQQGSIDIASGEIAIADIQSSKHTTAAYRKGAAVAAEQFETTKALNGFYDVLATDDGRSMDPATFDASYKELMSNVNTGDSSLDNVIRNNIVNNYKDISEFHTKQHRDWAEEDNYAKNTARGQEGLKFVDNMFKNGEFVESDYPEMINDVLINLDRSMPTADSKRAMFSVLSDEAYKNDNPVQAETIRSYLADNDINFTPRQLASNEQARRSHEARSNKRTKAETDLHSGMSKLTQGLSSALTVAETHEVVQHQLSAVTVDIADRQARGEDVSLPEELMLARADMAREGVYDTQYGKQQAANLSPTFYTGGNLTQLQQSSNDRKRLAVDEMTGFAENVQWDASTLANMFGEAAVKELLLIDTAKAGNVRDTETVLDAQARERDRQTGTRQGGAQRLPVDVKATALAVEAVFESNFLQKAFRFLLPYGNTMADSLNGFDRPAGDNDKQLAHRYINDAAMEAQFRNPQLTAGDATASAALDVMNNSVMIGENEGMLYARGRNITAEIGATDATAASDIVVKMAKELMLDLPKDVAAYYEFSPVTNSVIVEISHPSIQHTIDLNLPLQSISNRVKADAKAKADRSTVLSQSGGGTGTLYNPDDLSI